MVGAAIQLAPLYVIVMDKLGLNWDKMDTLVWVRAHNYNACVAHLSLCIISVFYCLEFKTDCRIPVQLENDKAP